jgi:hypothetical protein
MEIDKGVTMLVHSEPYELLILGCSCNPSGAVAALIYRTGQVKILEEVISDLKVFMDPLRAGDMSIQDLL